MSELWLVLALAVLVPLVVTYWPSQEPDHLTGETLIDAIERAWSRND